MNLGFDGVGTLQAVNTASVGAVTDLVTVRGYVGGCSMDSKSEFNFNLVRSDYSYPGACEITRVFPSPVSAQTLIIGTPLTVTFDNWRVGASIGASCTFTYSFSKSGGSAVTLGTPALNTMKVVELSQDNIQDEGTTFEI
jgi:hypothetical protein